MVTDGRQARKNGVCLFMLYKKLWETNKQLAQSAGLKYFWDFNR